MPVREGESHHPRDPCLIQIIDQNLFGQERTRSATDLRIHHYLDR
jgi:hypothetical protein